MSSSILLRVRTQVGTWRINDVPITDTFSCLKRRIESEHSTEITGPFSSEPGGKKPFEENITIQSAGLRNGDMIHVNINELKTGVHEAAQASGKTITKDGNIVAKEYSQVVEKNGFRPGMMPLRSMKMQWTLNDFMAMDEQFVFRITSKGNESVCTQVSVDTNSLLDFENYMRQLDFQRIRVGYLYGTIGADNKVKVECIYEPPQDTTDTSFVLLDDPLQDRVNIITDMLGLKKVGWIFSHPPREKGFNFSAQEIIVTAEQQLEAANGVEDTPFVTVKVTITVDENGNQVINPTTQVPEMSCEAFQVSKQCMEMTAEGVLIANSTNLGACGVNPTFTAMVEGKAAKEIDNDMFLMRVPIVQHNSALLITKFPKANREGLVQTQNDLKEQISKVDSKSGWSLAALLGDLQCLLFLSNVLDMNTDLPLICDAIVNPEHKLEEGFALIIRSIAGIE